MGVGGPSRMSPPLEAKLEISGRIGGSPAPLPWVARRTTSALDSLESVMMKRTPIARRVARSSRNKFGSHDDILSSSFENISRVNTYKGLVTHWPYSSNVGMLNRHKSVIMKLLP